MPGVLTLLAFTTARPIPGWPELPAVVVDDTGTVHIRACRPRLSGRDACAVDISLTACPCLRDTVDQLHRSDAVLHLARANAVCERVRYAALTLRLAETQRSRVARTVTEMLSPFAHRACALRTLDEFTSLDPLPDPLAEELRGRVERLRRTAARMHDDLLADTTDARLTRAACAGQPAGDAWLFAAADLPSAAFDDVTATVTSRWPHTTVLDGLRLAVRLPAAVATSWQLGSATIHTEAVLATVGPLITPVRAISFHAPLPADLELARVALRLWTPPIGLAGPATMSAAQAFTSAADILTGHAT